MLLQKSKYFQTISLRAYENKKSASQNLSVQLTLLVVHKQKKLDTVSSLFCSFGNRHPLCQTAWGMSWESKGPQSSRILVVCLALALLQLLALLTSLQYARATHYIRCFHNISKATMLV